MYEIRGFSFSFNTTKVIYVAEELQIEYDYRDLNIGENEHKTPEHLERHPLGKTPTLTHDGRHLFESGAICRYLAAVEGSALYSVDDHYLRSSVDQWMDFFSLHPGRWLTTLFFERVFRQRAGLGETNKENEEEAVRWSEQQLAAVNDRLASQEYLVGPQITIADLFAFAYVETTDASGFSLEPYPNVRDWYARIGSRDSIARARPRLQDA